MPLLTASLRPTKVRVRRPLVVVRFILTVGYDVLRVELRGRLGRRRRGDGGGPRARFVIVPLELRDPLGLAALAMVTTVVPGTVWSELALDRSALMLHVWDVDDEERLRRPLQGALREAAEGDLRMSPLLSGAIVFALGCYAVASVLVLVRLVGGPRAQDRVLALDLLYFHAMLVMLVLGIRHAQRHLLRGRAADRALQLRELVGDGEVHPARRGDRMNASVPFWVEAVVAALLVLSGVFVVISAIGFLRLQDFFLRMHPPALAYTFGSWCVTLAGILYFSMLESRLVLHPWLIIIMLSITVPVTTLLLARVALFRRRTAGARRHAASAHSAPRRDVRSAHGSRRVAAARRARRTALRAARLPRPSRGTRARPRSGRGFRARGGRCLPS